MDDRAAQPEIVTTVEPGVVRARVQVDLPRGTAWAALHDPRRLGLWFGDLDRPWQVGRPGRLDLGDGDFFTVTPTAIRDGRLIEFEWSFLGVGPPERVRWEVTGSAAGALIEVTDSDPARGDAEARQLAAGWADFLRRLALHLDTGRSHRYDWRGDIDGSVDLPPGAPDPLGTEVLYRWLPVAEDGFEPRWFFIVDEEGPRRFPLTGWRRQDGALRFGVDAAPAGTTWCTVTAEARVDGGTRLSFTHSGWRTLGLPDGRGRLLRRRFADTWRAALERVRELASGQHMS